MKPVYPVAEIRRAEAEAFQTVGDDVLMQRAAHGLANEILKLLKARRGKAAGAKVLILAGPGNNGGDALFAGARLAARGVWVEAARTAGAVHEAGWAALSAATRRTLGVPLEAVSAVGFDLVVDGVLGIGGRPGLPEPLAALARSLPPRRVVAVDLPSGLSADPPFGGLPHFKAGLTVTFGGLKPVHVLQPGRSACGEVALIDIGLGDMRPGIQVTELEDLDWPSPGPMSDKYSRGVVGVDAGSRQYPGAGVLAVTGAVHAGAGMVRFLGDQVVAEQILARYPNTVIGGPPRVDAMVLGPGWGERRDGAKVVAALVASGVPMAVDADGLRYLPATLRPDVVLTPHAGELARLLSVPRDEVEADPVSHTAAAAARWNATVLLKGANQVIATPGSHTVVQPLPGPAWTAQAGSGDVLAGVIGAFLAAGSEPVRAAQLGASLQALAAASNPGPLPPQELAAVFPQIAGA
ncbi:MAG: bifunctional ADP-dependent (S)-NAD(P)H-hydrate dehydratase/NAD(P)H-hydrate epimerase [Propionibacteriaceae bacterium]|jgi:hydroxyethylthiazole kinase-like uncharacterized protein yjeF|nr:bifunctional ADP-dependent (S)-NAD(P)H-hydrate dehydratase/NAD(P)H-hydrate epimerase [Propionibacteriaceae bacterium]